MSRFQQLKQILREAETCVNIIGRILAHVVIITFACVEGYKYIRWLMEK